MKTLTTKNNELVELLQNHDIDMTCNEDMQITISDEDAELIDDIVREYAPAASMDYSIEDEDVFDVHFDDDTDSNSKGINGTYDECMDYIRMYNSTDESYFADYKGGIVSIYNETKGEMVYCEEVR